MRVYVTIHMQLVHVCVYMCMSYTVALVCVYVTIHMQLVQVCVYMCMSYTVAHVCVCM